MIQFPSLFAPSAARRTGRGLTALAAIAMAIAFGLQPCTAAAQAPPAPPANGQAPPRFFPPSEAESTFTSVCAGCHGTTLRDARGPSLFTEKVLSALSDAALIDIIKAGVPDREMPAFGSIYTDAQISQIVAYMRIKGADLKGKPAFVPDPRNQIVKSQKQTFKIEVVAAGLDTPWGLAFLPDGRLLVTERSGNLRIISKTGKLQPEPVKGTPKVWVRQDAGMLDVAVHPDYAKNGWVYLSYAETAPGAVIPPPPPPPVPGAPLVRTPSPPSMTVLIRGRIKNNTWTDTQVIFRAPTELYTPSGAHYGSRFLFDGHGHVFYSLGERGDMTNAQKLTNPLGKIHRVNDDGSVPADNPFVHTPGADPTIWSYGHRNPQGLAWDPVTGLLWESEHGPTGGDEINIIEKGKNYGWGVISMGIQPGITKTTEPGMEQPIVYYTPAISPSGIAFYTGSRYPGWKNNLFVAGLVGQQLRRLEISGRKVVAQEVLFDQYGRTRAVATGPDGLLYALIQNPTGSGTGLSLAAATPGMVIRLVPVPQR